MIEKKYPDILKRFIKQKREKQRLWNISDETACFLYHEILLKKPKRILEIGTSNGYSTFWLSVAAEKIAAKIDSIEIDEDRHGLAVSNLKTRKNIFLHLAKAEDLLPQFRNQFDFVFIDAGKVNYIDYLKLLSKKLKPDSLIIADNVISHKESVQDYLTFVKENKKFITFTLEIGDGLEITKFVGGNE